MRVSVSGRYPRRDSPSGRESWTTRAGRWLAARTPTSGALGVPAADLRLVGRPVERFLTARAAVTDAVPGRAVARYEQELRRLAMECPEVAFWVNLVDHRATRQRLERLGTGLGEIERVLAELVAQRRPDDRRRTLAMVYRAALDRPVLDSGDAAAEVRIPPLRDGYVDPDFKVAEVTRSDRLAEESWWARRPVRVRPD